LNISYEFLFALLLAEGVIGALSYLVLRGAVYISNSLEVRLEHRFFPPYVRLSLLALALFRVLTYLALIVMILSFIAGVVTGIGFGIQVVIRTTTT